MDLKAPPKAGDKIKGTLVFEKAGKVEVEYTVRGIAGGAAARATAPGSTSEEAR